MKKVSLYLVLSTLFLFISCATIYTGKIVQSEQCQEIRNTNGKEHLFELTHVLVNYKYRIESSTSLIYLEGTIDKRPVETYGKPSAGLSSSESMVLENKRFKEGYLDVFFLGASRKVIDSVRVIISASSTIYMTPFPLPFKAVYKYNPEYKYIALAYKFVFVSTSAKITGLEKIYEHRLGIE